MNALCGQGFWKGLASSLSSVRQLTHSHLGLSASWSCCCVHIHPSDPMSLCCTCGLWTTRPGIVLLYLTQFLLGPDSMRKIAVHLLMKPACLVVDSVPPSLSLSLSVSPSVPPSYSFFFSSLFYSLLSSSSDRLTVNHLIKLKVYRHWIHCV